MPRSLREEYLFIGPEGAKLLQDYFGIDIHKIKDAPKRGIG